MKDGVVEVILADEGDVEVVVEYQDEGDRQRVPVKYDPEQVMVEFQL